MASYPSLHLQHRTWNCRLLIVFSYHCNSGYNVRRPFDTTVDGLVLNFNSTITATATVYNLNAAAVDMTASSILDIKAIQTYTTTIVETIVITTDVPFSMSATTVASQVCIPGKHLVDIVPRSLTVVPSSIPAYASACSGLVHYSSACSCVGVTNSITTVSPPSTTITITITSATASTTPNATTSTTMGIAANSTSSSTTTDASSTTESVAFLHPVALLYNSSHIR